MSTEATTTGNGTTGETTAVSPAKTNMFSNLLSEIGLLFTFTVRVCVAAFTSLRHKRLAWREALDQMLVSRPRHLGRVRSGDDSPRCRGSTADRCARRSNRRGCVQRCRRRVPHHRTGRPPGVRPDHRRCRRFRNLRRFGSANDTRGNRCTRSARSTRARTPGRTPDDRHCRRLPLY